MADIESSLVIARPPEAVYAFVADLRNHQQILPSTYSDFRVVTPSSTGVGAKLEFKIGAGGREFPASTEITVAQPPTRLVERADPKTEYWSEWKFAPEGDGTRVTLRTVYQPGGGFIGRLIDPLLGARRTQALQVRQLERLREVLEGGGARS